MATAIEGPLQQASEARCGAYQMFLRDSLPAAAAFAHDSTSIANLHTSRVGSKVSKVNMKHMEQAASRNINRREMKSPACGNTEEKEGSEVKRSRLGRDQEFSTRNHTLCSQPYGFV